VVLICSPGRPSALWLEPADLVEWQADLESHWWLREIAVDFARCAKLDTGAEAVLSDTSPMSLSQLALGAKSTHP